MTTTTTENTGKITIDASMSVAQIMGYVAIKSVELDTALDHFCTARYSIDAFTDEHIETIGLAEFRKIMKAQSAIQTRTAVAAATAGRKGKPKLPCAVSVAEFEALATALKITLEGCGGGAVYNVKPKLFNSGSMGWTVNQKTTFKVGEKKQLCQVGINVTLIRSKEMRLAEGWVPLTDAELKAQKAAAKAAGLDTEDDDDSDE